MRLACLASVAVLAWAAGAGAAPDDMIDSPEFASWSKFKPGASVTRKATGSGAGLTFEITRTLTLVEVGADKLVLEEVSVNKIGDKEVKSPAVKRDVFRTIKTPPGFKAEEYKDGKLPGTYEEGTETLKVGGAEIKTKWVKFKVETEGVKSDTRMWRSDAVPGGMVKAETTTTSAKSTITSTTELIEFKRP